MPAESSTAVQQQLPPAAGAAVPGANAYSQQFARLSVHEQERKVVSFARMDESELAALDFLTGQAKATIGQVRHYEVQGLAT